MKARGILVDPIHEAHGREAKTATILPSPSNHLGDRPVIERPKRPSSTHGRLVLVHQSSGHTKRMSPRRCGIEYPLPPQEAIPAARRRPAEQASTDLNVAHNVPLWRSRGPRGALAGLQPVDHGGFVMGANSGIWLVPSQQTFPQPHRHFPHSPSPTLRRAMER